MKAALLCQLGQPLEIREVALPKIEPDEVLVETRCCGICGTDIHMIEGRGYIPKLPHIPGHEPAGVIKEVGSRVRGLKPGDRVVPHLFLNCGKCWYCKHGMQNMCANLNGIIGVLVNGGFAEYFKAPARNLFKLPDKVSFESGGLVADAVVTAVHAVYDSSTLGKGDTAVVIGVGGIGQIILQLLKNLHVKVAAVSRSKEKQEIAKRLGADVVLGAGSSDLGEQISRLAQEGAACVFDCVGSEGSMKDALTSVRRHGRIVMVGEENALFPANTTQIAQRELEIIGSRNGTQENMRMAIQMLARGKVRPIIYSRYELNEINEALDDFRRGVAGRIVIKLHN